MKNALIILVVFGAFSVGLSAQTTSDTGGAESRVRELYDRISTEPGGSTPDWDQVRTFFLDDAVIFMRTSRTESAVFTLDAWVADFVSFIEAAKVGERGFTEKIVRLRSTEFRDIAEVMVLYEGSFPTLPRPPQQGVDMIHLARIKGEWKIVSIVNDIPENPEQIPEALKE